MSNLSANSCKAYLTFLVCCRRFNVNTNSIILYIQWYATKGSLLDRNLANVTLTSLHIWFSQWTEAPYSYFRHFVVIKPDSSITRNILQWIDASHASSLGYSCRHQQGAAHTPCSGLSPSYKRASQLFGIRQHYRVARQRQPQSPHV